MLLVGQGGCGAEGVLHSASEAALVPPSPATVLKTAYELEGGQRQVIFLDADELSEEELDQVAVSLESELRVTVLPAEAAFRGDPELAALTPVDPETGEVGVSLTLHEIAEVGSGECEAVISYARSGLDGGEVIMVYERRAGRWVLVDHFRGSQS